MISSNGRTLIGILMILISIPAAGSGQVVENLAKPRAANAGRIVTLKEELRIEDTGAGFFFKTPTRIRVSPRGDIFIRDGQEQALQFDPQGHFVRGISSRSPRMAPPSRRSGRFLSAPFWKSRSGARSV